MTRILRSEGAVPRVFGLFFNTVVQTVLIFESETWVVTPVWVRPWVGFRPKWRDS